MARLSLADASALTVADITHARFSAFPASATVADVKAWFAGSASHRMALFADEGRYAGSLLPEDLAGAADRSRPALEFARDWPTVKPDEPASRGEELALATPVLRVPVVDDDGRLVGIVAVTADRQGFCGTGGTDGCD